MFDMFFNKHYIRVNAEGMIIKGFSDAFEQPIEGDILINEKGGRHFEINGETNPSLFDNNMCHIFRFENNTIRKSTEDELALEWEMIKPVPVPTEMELIWQAITDLEIAQMEAELH